jgi:hypothetical protein
MLIWQKANSMVTFQSGGFSVEFFFAISRVQLSCVVVT